ncbi:hypothetical protein [Chryseobacterium sp. SL1]|uniref:hypothetical protein n=1 Tax=Chryseobacterium sp. SL1 TaxID=2995159 RepID=UPI0022743E44|nr:hypothetical protein [Chryseobacterium sp. SL1]MCY1662580.1 hypothetical protein [Chryseobacterium sp. SL1]
MNTLTLPATEARTKQETTMTKSPLSPVGVQGKVEELYALSDEQIEHEADAVQRDFKSWILQNFFLSFKQRLYLSNLNKQASDYFGSQCAVCFSNRLPIELAYPFPPETDYSKWTGNTNTMIVKSGLDGKPVATGKLVFGFTYTV